MTSFDRRQLGLWVVAMALSCGEVRAQTVAHSFAELQTVLKPDHAVVVVDETGRETKGRVADVSATSLTILTPEKRTFVEGAVTAIRRTDRVWNGMQNGFWLGLGVYVVSLGIVVKTADEPTQYRWLYPGLPIGVAAGAISGILVDRAVGNDPIYLALPRKPRPTATASPWLGKGAGGVSVSMRF